MKYETDAAVRKMLMTGYRHHSYAGEKAALDKYLNGEIEVLDYVLSFMGDVSYMLAPQRLRAVMNGAICLIAVVCRHVILRGADNEYCFALSDYYINRVEEIRSLDELKKLTKEILEDFREVDSRSEIKNRSPLIQKTLRYIDSHLYESCRVCDVACYVGRNANYLGNAFRKEMGVRITDYIRAQRMSAAKSMLLEGVRVCEVAESLGYSSAAHFSREFTRNSGISPSRYA